MARFLYTENPFYLVSCFLVLYGVQIMAMQRESALSRSLVMVTSTALYAVLMAVTVVAVVRVAKVWRDARSIFLVVLIALVAYSSGFDETCVNDPQTAWGLAIVGAVLSVGLIEMVLRGCRLSLPAAYRWSLHAMFAVFLFLPPIFGSFVRGRYDSAAGWAGVIFSMAFALAMLLLIPAMRRQRMGIRNNGSPWTWPAYPLAAFVILVVLAGIRSHAIWMSFGFYGGRVRFEPFLWLPLVTAALVLLAEVDLRRKRNDRPCALTAMSLSPMVLFAAMNGQGQTALPIATTIESIAGSAGTVSLITLTLFLCYLAAGRLALASTAAVGGVVATAVFMHIPDWMLQLGIQRGTLLAVAATIVMVWAWKRFSVDVRWTIASTAAAVAAGWILKDRVGWEVSVLSSVVFWTVAVMIVGAIYETELTQTLRYVAALLIVGGSCGLVLWWHQHNGAVELAASGLVAMSILAAAYLLWTRRRGWGLIASVPMVSGILMVSILAYRGGRHRQINWPLSGGAACFVAGIAVTTTKTEWMRGRKLKVRKSTEENERRFFREGI